MACDPFALLLRFGRNGLRCVGVSRCGSSQVFSATCQALRPIEYYRHRLRGPLGLRFVGSESGQDCCPLGLRLLGFVIVQDARPVGLRYFAQVCCSGMSLRYLVQVFRSGIALGLCLCVFIRYSHRIVASRLYGVHVRIVWLAEHWPS